MKPTVYKCVECCGNEEPCIFVVFGTADKPTTCPIINEEETTPKWIETDEYVIAGALK